ncbi:ComF family protein [Schleiferilactobacillus harbinensis]|uniref:ComF family protein n=1 Tax=Schleiferilactobacillus harbinensis TaxID=304207 RepID=UPI001AAFEA7C|nr:ComF family protein [Schleiferilactobacillus harbinensis]MBO3091359.1 ComF family protein [Schleiferilactobacillus harbinensis]MCT2907897.1 ComF family protein [Schleiferilactobacillus harbinensis]
MTPACGWCGRPWTITPTFGALCSLRRQRPATLCPECRATFLPWSAETVHCPRCHRPGAAVLCADCQYWQQLLPWLDGQAQHLFAYHSPIQMYFERFKRQGDYQLAAVFAADIGDWWRTRRRHYDAVIPVPSDPVRARQRGFDPVTALFASVLPLTPVLEKQGTTPEQAQQDRATRLTTRQPFIYQPQRGVRLRQWRRILLVDDIYTTGSTLHQTAAVLHAAGSDAVMDTFTLAR